MASQGEAAVNTMVEECGRRSAANGVERGLLIKKRRNLRWINGWNCSSFDYDTQRGELCPMAAHVAFPYVEILRYGGTVPVSKAGDIRFCCPDVDVINVFSLEVVKQDEE